MRTPLDCLKRNIAKWEGEFQAQANDPGNYVTMPDGSRKLIGTMRGVTPAVLAAHRGIATQDVTTEIMQSVTLDEAAEIGLTRFYRGTGLDLLAWGPATDALVDFGWGSGPGQAAKSLQRLVGCAADGIIGPLTVEAYARWVADRGWEAATRAVRDMRIAFYELIISRNPALGIYRQGWKNRADWMTPDSAEWWASWKADPAPLPSVADVYAGPLPKPVEPAPTAPVRSETSTQLDIGKTITGATALVGAGAPVAQAFLGADWKVAAVGGGVIAVLGVIGFFVFRDMSARHRNETKVGL